MRISYDKLRHLLLDRKMTKIALEEKAGISHYQMYKIANDRDLDTSVIRAICVALGCMPADIMEYIPEETG